MRCLTLADEQSMPLSAVTMNISSMALMIFGFFENRFSLPRVSRRRLETYPSLSSGVWICSPFFVLKMAAESVGKKPSNL